MRRCQANLPNRCRRQIDRIARRAFDGEQWMDREGRAATTGNTYCGNLLWQSSLTLLALDLYDYGLTSNCWIRTVTHLHEQSPAPVSGKTTRDIKVTNARGEEIETRTEAMIDGIWYTIARNRMTYNLQGKRITSENLAGQVTTTAWDCCHKVSEIGPDGSTTTWDYDDEGRMIASSRLIPLDMTNVTWLTTCYEYDDLGRQVATWKTNYAAQVGLPVTRTRYDALGRVKARVDQLGNTTTTTYSPDGRTVSVHNPNTSTRVTTRSADGSTLSITGSAVTPEFYTYGILADGTRWSRTVQGETAASPRFTKRYENLLGQTIREERSGFQGAVLATTHVYDSLGRLVSTSADYEPTTEYAYDTMGNRIAVTKLVGRGDLTAPMEWRKTETLSSFVLSDAIIWLTQTNIVSCSDSAVAPLVSSSARQLTGLTPALPSRACSTDIRGNMTETETLVDDSFVTARQSLPYAINKPLSISRYGVPLMDVSVSAVTNTVAYDSLGRQIANTDGRGNSTHTEYNSLGQRSASVDALGNSTAYAYDRYGNLASITNPLGNVTIYEYDLRGRKTYEGGATYPVRYTYDIFGNKSTMMTYRNESLGPGSGDVTTWLYDEASGCMTNKVYADGKGPSYSYTPDGKLSQRIWARGIVTGYAYDDWNDIVSIDYSDATPDVALHRNMMGNVTNVIDGAGSLSYVIDCFRSIDRKIVESEGDSVEIDLHYDSFGRDAGYSINGDRITYCRYAADTGRVQEMYVNACNGSFRWEYLNGTDLKSRMTYPDGSVVGFEYEERRNVITACRNGDISSFSYAHNELAQITNSTFGVFSYSARGELVSSANQLQPESWSYDDAGNRESARCNALDTAYSANSINQIMAFSNTLASIALHYDDDGNQLEVLRSGEVWDVQYDAENRPFLWSRRRDGKTIDMVYDWVGRRVSAGDRRFNYIGYKVVGSYVWDPTGGASAVPLLSINGGNVTYLFQDGYRNIVDSKGEVVTHRQYSPYGSSVSGDMSDGIGYSSEYYDEDVGIVFYPFRAYDPENGRWLQRDPAEEGISPHLYVYAKNDPVGHADYLGLAKYDCRRANSTFSFSKEFSGASGVLPSISISIQRTIEEERCTIDCDKCKKGYSIERTITDSSGAGFTLKEIGPVVILGVPMYFSLDVGANVYGNKFYYYDSCTDKSTESGEACVSVTATVSGGPCVKVGPFIKICAKAALTAKWDSCSDQLFNLDGAIYVEQCYFGQCWSADIISGKLW